MEHITHLGYSSYCGILKIPLHSEAWSTMYIVQLYGGGNIRDKFMVNEWWGNN